MRPADSIKRSIKKLNITATPDLHDRVLGSLLKTMEESTKQPSAITRPSVWRMSMKTRITKFAIAAVIVIGVLVGINQFGASIDGASVAFAKTMSPQPKESPTLCIHCSSR